MDLSLGSPIPGNSLNFSKPWFLQSINTERHSERIAQNLHALVPWQNSLAPDKCAQLILAAITVTKEAPLSLASQAKDDFDLWGWGRAETGKAVKKAKVWGGEHVMLLFPFLPSTLPLCSFKANAMLWLEWEVLRVLTWPHGSLLLSHVWVRVRGWGGGERKGFRFHPLCTRACSLQWHSYWGCAGEPTSSHNVREDAL